MDTVIKKVELSLPEMDMVLLKELAEKYGWSIGKKNQESKRVWTISRRDGLTEPKI